jgi:carboxylesterase type B
MHLQRNSFVFGNAWPPLVHTFGVNETAMITTFQRYWSNMATSGSPNQPNHVDVQWPPFENTNRLAVYTVRDTIPHESIMMSLVLLTFLAATIDAPGCTIAR